jgi:hypothetical protein
MPSSAAIVPPWTRGDFRDRNLDVAIPPQSLIAVAIR